jgi:hypothetical protein
VAAFERADAEGQLEVNLIISFEIKERKIPSIIDTFLDLIDQGSSSFMRAHQLSIMPNILHDSWSLRSPKGVFLTR